MSKKDYYSILCVEKNATEEDIKKSYKKLALQYHPDKNQGNAESTEKFKEVAEAYGVIGNKEKRSQYDMMGCDFDDSFEGEDPFSVFNNIFQQHMGSFMNMKYEKDINIGSMFGGSPFGNVHVRVHTFPTDVFTGIGDENNNVLDDDDFGQSNLGQSNIGQSNLGGLFETLFKHSKIGKSNKSVKSIKTKILYNKPDDIVYDINVSFSDIYNQTKKKINISRMRKKDGEYIDKKKKIEIPIYGKELLLEGEGNELKDYKEKGDIVINIFNNKEDNFRRVNEYDILTNKSLNVNQLYSLIIYDITLPNCEVIKVKCEDMIGCDNLIQKISKKGLPYENDEDELCYGDLYVMYKIIFPKTIDELRNINVDNADISDIAGINDIYNIARNCSFEEIFMD
jgi:DnaJ-class molecular chaperone